MAAIKKLAVRRIQDTADTFSNLSGMKVIFIEKIYRPYLKPINFIHKTLIWLYLHFGKRAFYYYCYITKSISKRLISLSEASASQRIVLADEIQVENRIPPVYPWSRKRCLDALMGKYTFPQIFVGKLDRCQLNGHSNLIRQSDSIIHHDLYNPNEDILSEESHFQLAVNVKKLKACWIFNDRAPEKIDTAAVFLDACASNYAHWMTEVLPRIFLFCERPSLKGIPLIVNDGLHQNIMRSLSAIIDEGREIILLPRNRTLDVDSLFVISPTGYVPFDTKHPKAMKRSHGQFSPTALSGMIRRIKDCVLSPEKDLPSRLFIRRSSGTRLLLNTDEIERNLVNEGFTVIDPDKLSFDEQVSFFSNAEIVIGPTGAAMANIMFCKATTKVVVLFSEHQNMPYWYWQNMAAPMGIEVTYVIGDIVDKKYLGIHADFEVKLADVLSSISDS